MYAAKHLTFSFWPLTSAILDPKGQKDDVENDDDGVNDVDDDDGVNDVDDDDSDGEDDDDDHDDD